MIRMQPVSTGLLFLCFLNTFVVGTDNPNQFTSDVSVNCGGSSGTSAAFSGREWLGDAQTKLPSLLQIKGSSTTSNAIHKLMSADPIPHKTARVSRSKFSYLFQVTPGQKILRLHFNPVSYQGFKKFKDLFTVEAGPFTLLKNFSPSLSAEALGVDSFAKEFCINIEKEEYRQLINITFSPENSKLQDTYAFINGIEIISLSSALSYSHDRHTGIQVVGKSVVYVDYGTAFEIIQKRNLKQNSGEFEDLFPVWATGKANKKITNNTWSTPVDVGFRYLIRLHFTELGLKMVETGDVIFEVLINGMNAQNNIDRVKESNDNDILLWYRDYMVMMRGHKREGKRDLLVSLQSYDESIDEQPLLAGYEILKLSNPDNSLASPNPVPPEGNSPPHACQTLLSRLGHRNSTATVVITIIALVNIIIHMVREVWEAGITEEENKPSAKAERVCRRFSLDEIQLATRNFSSALVIGKGGFGNVYRGLIDNGQEYVAIKRLKPSSRQGPHEFLTEIETLSELRHVNLVSLIGYCNEHGEMILVYEYVASGTLADHLYKLARDGNNCSSLTWKQRLNICIGAGRGLDYLHTGHSLIHRDVKSSNILLDANFIAKVSDFGLAKPEDRSKLQSHISTNVKGTFGYFDPNYLYTHKLTRKSDVYSFGVVLMEVLCGRPAMASRVPEDERILTKWAIEKISTGEVDQIVASSLREEISPDSLKTFVGIAERCLYEEPKKRPTMSQVVLQLEFALEQQEIKPVSVPNEIPSVSDDIHSCNDENNLSDTAGQSTMATTEEQDFTSPHKEQTNSKMANDELSPRRKHGRKETYKPSRLRPWDIFWNRVKPSKKNDFFDVNIKVPHFDWALVAAATNQFSFSYKIGQGGFGPVYKGVLPTGQVVAVKRLSRNSMQGLEEFKNEIILLDNFQHRNIIKLLGYCIGREDVLYLYEFMENKSLDTFLDQRQPMEWTQRLRIIIGIARGILYLHQDSRLRVIHRDLTPRNILLDIDMNPKISGFSFSRTLDYNQTELYTVIAGTRGYLAPEYLRSEGISVKTDVYSFGIIVLEIVSGRKCTKPIMNDGCVFLVQYAWKRWNEGNMLDLVDGSLGGEFSVDGALRCIQVGLLCTQELPQNRPAMSSVLKMLEGEEVLVDPQQPWHPRGDSDATSEFDDETL